MKRLLLLGIMALFGVGLSAQVVPQGLLERKGMDLLAEGRTLSSQEQMLLLSDIGGNDYWEEWQTAQKQYAIQTDMMIFGGIAATVCLPVAFALAVVYDPRVFVSKPFWPYASGALLLGSLGAASFGVGLGWRIKLNNRLDGIVGLYNEGKTSKEPASFLSIGPTCNGVGLMIAF